MSAPGEDYIIKSTSVFDKKVKEIVKKYPQFKQDLKKLFQSLKTQPLQGSPLKGNLRKIRIPITGKAAGKSYGARAITGIYIEGKTVFLLSVYDKSLKKDLTEKERKELEEIFNVLKKDQ